jgi:ABC-type antimicrobial peptide transport system permease subunit
MVEHWPFVVLSIYSFDLLLLLAIGKVPVAYNVRNVMVRWRISALTALAFTVVVALVIVLLAFVNGMYELNDGSGVPGSTDEVFSNLGYGDVDNIPTVTVSNDAEDVPLPAPVRVKKGTGADGKPAFLMSKEIFYTVNQSIPNPAGGVPRRRFLQLRAMVDSKVSAEVHNVTLAKGNWFNPAGITTRPGPDGRPRTYIETVIGDGVAAILGEDVKKDRLDVNDTFAIGDTDWLVVGVMKSEGKTFGSEIWAQNTTLITKPFGKDKYTTLVLRTEPETDEAAKAMAYHLQYRYDQQKVKAFSEREYFKELTKTNEDFLTQIIILAVVMAVGGVFGVMNTMFASIAARIKEVGVLRILGFKRWQILISFMLESLAIAFIGGLVGCLIGLVANGFEATSTLSGQGGGGKRVLLKLTVDYQTIAAGILFTLMMGRIGGLVPALSAMRMKILDTLK